MEIKEHLILIAITKTGTKPISSHSFKRLQAASARVSSLSNRIKEISCLEEEDSKCNQLQIFSERVSLVHHSHPEEPLVQQYQLTTLEVVAKPDNLVCRAKAKLIPVVN